MNLEQIALRAAEETDTWFNGQLHRNDPIWVQEYTRRLVAALGAQEPVGEADSFGLVWWKERPPQGTKLFAAPQIPPREESALTQFNKLMADGEVLPPLERLRAFCAIALTRQDWVDVEPFFEAIQLPPHEGWQLVPKELTEEMGQALTSEISDIYNSYEVYAGYKAMLAAAPEYKP